MNLSKIIAIHDNDDLTVEVITPSDAYIMDKFDQLVQSRKYHVLNVFEYHTAIATWKHIASYSKPR